MAQNSILMSYTSNYHLYTPTVKLNCGINNVYFDGKREDWVLLISKMKHLAKYDVDGGLKKYITHVEVILQNFLKTFDGNPDVGWWNNIMTTE